MWQQAYSGKMTWNDALAGADTFSLAGYNDWRLPNAKELQSIVDYTRSPDTTGSAAIDPVFSATQITNEAGQADYPFYWTGTTHVRGDGSGGAAAYVAFGRGLGSMDGVNVIDVHGAGCQRSDPKNGDPNDYPSWGNGPQGDVQRVFNYVRLVRDAGQSSLPGDVNGDCVVDIVDIMLVAARWGAHVGDANYNSSYDLDHDGDIDVVDIMEVAAHWGETCG
jgi:hypothetical protein